MDYESYWFGPNDGGVKRGDREETGDNEARPTRDPVETEGDGGGSRGGIEDLPEHDEDDPALDAL